MKGTGTKGAFLSEKIKEPKALYVQQTYCLNV